MSRLQHLRRWLGPQGSRSALIALTMLVGVVGFPTGATAQKAAIVTAVRSTETAWWGFIKQKIADTGMYPDGIDQVESAFTAPSLATLSNYKLLVVLSSDYGLASADSVGNVLGDYMATVPGGNILLFQPYTWQTGLYSAPAIAGKFLTNNALTTQSATAATTATKRGMVLSNDPLGDGVAAFDCGSNCSRVTGAMPLPGATVSAYWADGTILAVRGKHRVDLNMFPADDSVISGSWKPAGGDLVTNAIMFLSAPVTQSPRKAAFPSTGLGGATAPVTITFRNISDAPIDVTGIGLDGTGKGQFTYKAATIPSPASPLTLPIGASYKVSVTFKPQIQGSHKAVLYLSLAGLSRIEAPLEGTSVGNLYVSLSPIDFGGIPTGSTAGPVTVRLKNLGTMPIDLQKPVLGDTKHFTMTTSVPDATITMFPGASYSFDVKFDPGMDVGQLSSQVTITSTDAGSPLTIPILAMAGPPQAQVPFTSILLPDVPSGAMGMPLAITITNTGFSDLLVTEISADKDDFTIPNAPSTMSPLKIPAQQMTSFQLVFAPKAVGLRTGKLTIKTNEPPAPGAPDSNKVILLSGNGTAPKFKVDVTELDFGTATIGTPVASKTVNLTNDGDGDLMVKQVDIIAGTGASSFTISTLESVPFVLRAGSTIPVTVSFVPKAAGMISATMRVVTDLGTGGSAMISLKGTANGAVGSVNPATVNFGDAKVKQKTTKSFTISNNGNQDLTILKSGVTPTVGIFAAMLPPDGTKIAPGKSLTIDVTAMPAMAGPATGRIDILTDDPSVSGGAKFSVALTINGVLSNVTVMPAELTFQPILVGRRSDMQVIKVTNVGTVTIDNLTVAISASPMAAGDDSGNFSPVPGFKNMLAPGESSDIGIIFEPRVAKNMMLATAVLQADGVQVPMTVALKASSMSATLSAQPSLLRFDNTIVGMQTQPKYVTVSNDGAQDVELDVIPPTTEDWTVDTSESKLLLGAGETTRIAVLFAPKSSGPKGESIDIRLKGTMVSLVKIDLDGTGVKAPTVPMDMGSGCHMTGSAHAHSGADWAPLAIFGLLAGFLLLRRRARARARD